MTPDQLRRAADCTQARATVWAPILSAACALHGIDSPARLAGFVSQVAHESGRLVYVSELWGPTPAQARYEGRADLGNTQPGDGGRFRGRGLIQVTGRANYRKAAAALGIDCETRPELLALPEHAAASAAWFWSSHGLNALADKGTDDAFAAITRKINGGLNGIIDRRQLWAMAKNALGA
jgi:putative chitinase